MNTMSFHRGILSFLNSHNRLNERKYILRWFLLILLIKLLMFVYFTIQFRQYGEKNQVRSGIAVVMGDTRNYYVPAEEFAKNWNYPSMCRMPGLLPVYVPLYWIAGAEGAWVGMVIFQFLFSVVSVLLLAIIAARMLGGQFTFAITALVFALSSFVSIWDHTLMADSLSSSSLILSVYLLCRYLSNARLSALFLCGLVLTWSVFLRQIAVVLFPVFVLVMLSRNGWSIREFIRSSFILGITPVVLISLWTWRNYEREGLIVPFIKPVESCYVNYSQQYITISRLLIVWGFDIQHWHNQTPAEWFSSAAKQTRVFEGADRLTTSVCNADTLLALQHAYAEYRTEKDSLRQMVIGNEVLAKCSRLREAYIRERPMDYYFLNRFILLGRFLFPERLDNLPGPAFSEMNMLQRIVKLGYYGLLLLVNLGACLITVYWLLKRRWLKIIFTLIPWSIAITLAMLLGFVEQRYFVPIYPFFVAMLSWAIAELAERRWPMKST